MIHTQNIVAFLGPGENMWSELLPVLQVLLRRRQQKLPLQVSLSLSLSVPSPLFLSPCSHSHTHTFSHRRFGRERHGAAQQAFVAQQPRLWRSRAGQCGRRPSTFFSSCMFVLVCLISWVLSLSLSLSQHIHSLTHTHSHRTAGSTAKRAASMAEAPRAAAGGECLLSLFL